MRVRAVPQHLTITGALALALCLLALLGTADRAQALLEGEDYRTGQVIVKLDNTQASGTIRKINAAYGSRTLDNTLGRMGIYLLEPPDSLETEAFAGLLMDEAPQNGVIYAEPNFIAEAAESDAAEGDGRHRAWGISSSSESSDQYADENLGLSSCAVLPRRPGRGVTVAVLDTGAQLGHPALKTRFKDVKRYDFVDGDKKPSDLPAEEPQDNDGDGYADEMVGHGTHVAGIVARVAPRAKIMPLRVLDREGYGDVFTVSRAIRYAWRNGADVINLSLGTSVDTSGPLQSKLLEEMVKKATTEKGLVVAAAAGNSNTPVPHYPAAGDGVTPASADGLVAVTSVGEDQQKSDFANYGTWVDVAAPGEGIRSAFPVSQYANWDGTSMSTPFVSGQAALIDQVYGSIKPEDIEEKIRNTARPEDRVYSMLGAKHADVCASLQR
jgi:subtilisin family serine protease